MGSAEVRNELRRHSKPWHHTRGVHELGRAYGRERLHLTTRPARRTGGGDLLWGADDTSYKVVTRSVSGAAATATFEVAAATRADYLLLVLIDRRTLRLVEMARVTWSIVEWLGKPHGTRWRLRWNGESSLRGLAELL